MGGWKVEAGSGIGIGHLSRYFVGVEGLLNYFEDTGLNLYGRSKSV